MNKNFGTGVLIMNDEVENYGGEFGGEGDVSQPEASEANASESFEQLLTDFEFEAPKRGQLLEGEVISIDEDAILVDVGLKRDAVVSSREIDQLTPEYLENLKVGNQVVVYVLRSPMGDEDLIVSLTKGIEYESWQNAQNCLEEGTILDLEVVGYNKGGILVKFEHLRGFVPASHIPALRRGGGHQRMMQIKQDMVGSTLAVKTIEVNRQRNRLVFSALAAQEERRKKRLQEIEEGQIFLRAKVVSVVDFGVFVDLKGVDGLVHISELDWKVVNHPSDLFKPGDEIDVQVISVDVENERVSLSRKTLLPNPWEEVEEKYHPGDVIQGEVTRVLDFGAFVKVDEGIEGLVHSSEIGYSASGKPQDVVNPGEIVLVRVLSVDSKKGRISLSMKRVPIGEQINWMAEEIEPGESENEEDAPEVAPDASTEQESS